MAAAGTAEAVRPAARCQILLAGLLGCELASELMQILSGTVGAARAQHTTDCGRLKQPDNQELRIRSPISVFGGEDPMTAGSRFARRPDNIVSTCCETQCK